MKHSRQNLLLCIAALYALMGMLIPKSLVAAAATRPDGWTVGEKTILFVRVDMADKAGDPISLADAQTMMASVDAFFRDVSGGKTNLRTTFVPTTLRVPQSSSYYGASVNLPPPELIADAKQAALAYDRANGGNGTYDADRYSIVIVFNPFIGNNPNAGGSASGDGTSIYINGCNNALLVAHELGHCYGLPEGSFWQAASSNPVGDGKMVVYGNIFEVMGAPDYGGHFSARGKHFLKWLSGSDVQNVTQSGTYRLFRHDHAQASGLRAIAVPSKQAGTRTYWIETRRLPAMHSRLANGVLISWSTPVTNDYTTTTNYYRTLRNEELILLDMKPQSASDPYSDVLDSALVVGESFADVESGVVITPVATGGTAPYEWVDVQITVGGGGNPTPNSAVGMTGNFSERIIQQGAVVDVPWTRSGLGPINVEYSLDGGASWLSVAKNVAAATQTGVYATTGSYRWKVPSVASGNAKLRVSDASDPSRFAVSDTFSITPDNAAQVHLAADADTVALFHFEGDCSNESTMTGGGTARGSISFEDGGIRLGQAMRFDNRNGGAHMVVAESSAFSLADQWTVQFWMKANTVGGTFSTVGWVVRMPTGGTGGDPLLVSLNNDRTMSVAITSATGKTTNMNRVGRVELGQWYHVALVGDSQQSTLCLYLQDEKGAVILKKEVSVTAADLTLKNDGKALAIGGGGGTSNVQFDGWLDELQIIRKAVDPTKTPATGVGRLTNLSVLTSLAGNETMSIGTVLAGEGSEGKAMLLVRAAGPSLGKFGLSGLMADPKLELFDVAAKSLATNDNWAGEQTLTAAFSRLGAFPFDETTSKDAALLTNLGRGNYTVSVSGKGGEGTVIAELYDASDAGAASGLRLANLSVLKQLGSGLTVGFVVGGDGPRKLLIRAVGPALEGFGMGGVLSDPKLELYDGGSTKISSNDNWGGTAALKSAFSATYAFGLPEDSKDAALLVSLKPGMYSVRISGSEGSAGIVLVEVYEAP